MTTATVSIGDRKVGLDQPAFVCAEIGINHNGSLDTARRLIDAAAFAGCDAVKFQKRTPEICTPPDQRDLIRETPWGRMTYLDYRHRVEFGPDEFAAIRAHCADRGILWFGSPWDEPSVAFLDALDPPCHKIPSACITDHGLVRCVVATGRTVVLSTGMSTLEEIDAAVALCDRSRLVLLHCTSTYPAAIQELNLAAMATLRARYGVPVGYSGHETGLAPTVAAVALGACFVERHITLDRAMWGSDQAASVEPQGFWRLVRDIRAVEAAIGDGVKRVYPSEEPILRRLRRVR